MNLPPASSIDPAIAIKANEALRIARGTFLKGIRFRAQVTESLPMGVSFDHSKKISSLSINPHNSLAASLMPAVGNWTHVWLLIIAHEAGHLRLNSICQANSEDPDDTDAQLKAIGIDPTVYSTVPIANFQKETAIEAFCDCCMGKAAMEIVGQEWKKSVEALRDHRLRDSEILNLFKGDEYATAPALDEMLRLNGEIEPAQAARIAFEISLKTTSSLKKRAVAVASLIPEFKANIRERLKRWRKSSSNEDSERPPPRARK